MIGKDNDKASKRIMERIFTAALFIMILLFLKAIFEINLKGFVYFCDTDMYLDTLVAKRMWEQKTLFPSNWIFGNQYYVIATPVLCALLYGVCGNLNLAMGMASNIMTIFILLSFIWMLWPFVRKKRHIVVGVAALLGCVVCDRFSQNWFGQLFFIMCSYYACYLITGFVVWGEYIRLCAGKDLQNKRSYYGLTLMCMVLSFCTGMQSIRQTIIMVIPMCLMELSFAFYRSWKNKKLCCERSGIFAFLNLCANLLGLLCIYMMRVPKHVIYGETRFIGSISEFKENVRVILQAVKETIGYSFHENIWITVLSLVMVMVFIAVIITIIRQREQSRELTLLIALFLLSLLVVIGGKAVTHMTLRSVYLFFWFPMICLCVVYFFENCRTENYLIYGIVFLILLSKSYGITYGSARNEMVQEEARYRESVEIAEWMQANGYHTILGGWDSASEVAVASNGNVTGFCWSYETPEDIFQIAPWIVQREVFEEEWNEGAVYMIYNSSEGIFRIKAEQMGAEVEEVNTMEIRDCKLFKSSRHLIYYEEDF